MECLGAELPRNPASTRHNLLTSQTDKVKRWKAWFRREKEENSCTWAISFSHSRWRWLVACGTQFCHAKASEALPSDASVTLKRQAVDPWPTGCLKSFSRTLWRAFMKLIWIHPSPLLTSYLNDRMMDMIPRFWETKKCLDSFFLSILSLFLSFIPPTQIIS